MTKNLLYEKLRNGKMTFGCWITIGHPDVPDVLSNVGYDFYVFDLEHAPITLETLSHLLIATPKNITPAVRLPNNEPHYFNQVLDMGIQTLLVPSIENREDMVRAVRNSKYPPAGIRGMGPRRASSYGSQREEYVSSANDETLVVGLVESPEGVRNVEEIMSTPGLGAWFVGPVDLASALGRDQNSPEVQSAVEKVVSVGLKSGIPGGRTVKSLEDAKTFAERGFKIFTLGLDYAFMRKEAASMFSSVKKAVSPWDN